jgi:RNA 2',3'-cyclic 3'-phosphodiesterase
MPRPNWFFGFPIAGEFVLELPALPPNFRRLHPGDVHLTLAFLGGCGEAGATRALQALDERMVGPLRTAIDVSLGQVVPMGPRARYSALSALLSEGREMTETRITELRDALTLAATGRIEQRAAKAHVTLVRPSGRATEAQRAAGLAWASGLDLSKERVRLTRVALYTWSENRAERSFRIVSERTLDPW